MDRASPNDGTARHDHKRCADALAAFPRFGNGVGLHRVAHLLREAGSTRWLREQSAIKVTGSKGKGSTSATIASILRVLGFRTGLFTSPHLCTPAERIQVDGVAIGPGVMAERLQGISDARHRYERVHPGDLIGGFEALTVAAAMHMQESGVEASVWEVGIGGRYDPVRLIPGAVSALTSVELEHTAILGSTREAIAYDKSDLCETGGILVCGDVGEEIIRRLRIYAGLRGVSIADASELARIENPRYAHGRMRFELEILERLKFSSLDSPLLGPHQAGNTAVAVLAVLEWLARRHPDLLADTARLSENIARGIAEVHWPGRLERVAGSPETYIDIAHTPASTAATMRTLRSMYPHAPLVAVCGVSVGKDAHGIAGEVRRAADHVVWTQADYKGLSAAELAAMASGGGKDPHTEIIAAGAAALARACVLASAVGGVVIVLGSMYLAVETRTRVKGEDPDLLWFF